MTQEQLSHSDKLILPENIARFEQALESLPRGDLAKWFIAYFRKQPLRIWRLLEKPPKVVQAVRDEDIVQSLERIRLNDEELLVELAKLVDALADRAQIGLRTGGPNPLKQLASGTPEDVDAMDVFEVGWRIY